MKQDTLTVDALILGNGIAGSITALELARRQPAAHILLITREHDPNISNTRYAQGGIIAKHDAYLVEDILQSGAGLGNEDVATIVATEGPLLVQQMLVDIAHVPFDSNSKGELVFALEGGHREPRVAKVADSTGKAIQEHLTKAIQQVPAITLATTITAIDLLIDNGVCIGASVFDQSDQRVSHVLAKNTVLATGGASFLFAHTTNPPGARGDGIAMAYRAGAALHGMEFEQFHPTALALPGVPAFLISEAVRGAGARLTDENGIPFMHHYYPELEKPDLATRDKVSRAIYVQMQTMGTTHVYLDLRSYIPKEDILSHFPMITAMCNKFGIDITTDLVPVAPAAHYFCGGVATDTNGQTSLPHLYAVGEVASTGLHGANRLASTSLEEGVVFGVRAARAMGSDEKIWTQSFHPIHQNRLKKKISSRRIEAFMKRIQRTMWEKVGVVRSTSELARAIAELTELKHTIDALWSDAVRTDELIGLRNAICVAVLIAQNALANESSVGCHWRKTNHNQ